VPESVFVLLSVIPNHIFLMILLLHVLLFSKFGAVGQRKERIWKRYVREEKE